MREKTLVTELEIDGKLLPINTWHGKCKRQKIIEIGQIMGDRTRDIITLDSMLDEVEQVRQMALNENDYKTALTCIMSKSKLLGGGLRLELREKDKNDPITKMLGM